MTDKEQALMYAEVDDILNYLGEEYINKVPEDLLRVIHIFKDKNYVSKTKDSVLRLNQMGFSEDTRCFIAMLNLQFWIDDEEEKQRLIEHYKENERIYQEEFSIFMDTLNNNYIS